MALQNAIKQIVGPFPVIPSSSSSNVKKYNDDIENISIEELSYSSYENAGKIGQFELSRLKDVADFVQKDLPNDIVFSTSINDNFLIMDKYEYVNLNDAIDTQIQTVTGPTANPADVADMQKELGKYKHLFDDRHGDIVRQLFERVFIMHVIYNSLTLNVYESFGPIHVVGMGFNDGKDPTSISECERVLYRSLYLLHGSDFAFRSIDPDECFRFLCEYKYAMVVEGTRIISDGHKPASKVYICTDDDKLCDVLSRKRASWNKVFDIIVIKVCKHDKRSDININKTCFDYIYNGIPHSIEQIGALVKCLYYSYMEDEPIDQTKKMFIVNKIPPERCTNSGFRLRNVGYTDDVWGFLCEDYIVYFGMWLSAAMKDKTKQILKKQYVESAWRLTRYRPSTSQITISNPYYYQNLDYSTYARHVQDVILLLHKMFLIIQQNVGQDSSCCGLATWIQKQMLDYTKCLAKTIQDKKDKYNMCELALLRGKFLVEVNRVVQFHAVIEQMVKQQAISPLLVGKAEAKFSDVYVQLSTRVIPWLQRATRFTEADYKGIILVKSVENPNCATDCLGQVCISNGFVQLQNARAAVPDSAKNVFKSATEPDLNALLKYIETHRGTEEGLLAEKYLHTFQASEVDNKLIEYNLNQEEVASAAAQLSDAVRDAVEKAVEGSDPNQYLLILRAMLSEFSQTMGQSDGRLLQGMLDYIKSTYDSRMESDIEGAKIITKLEQLLAHSIDEAGVESILSRGGSSLSGLGALLQAPHQGDVANSNHAYRSLTEAVISSMGELTTDPDPIESPNHVLFGSGDVAYVASKNKFVDFGKLVEI